MRKTTLGRNERPRKLVPKLVQMLLQLLPEEKPGNERCVQRRIYTLLGSAKWSLAVRVGHWIEVMVPNKKIRSEESSKVSLVPLLCLS